MLYHIYGLLRFWMYPKKERYLDWRLQKIMKCIRMRKQIYKAIILTHILQLFFRQVCLDWIIKGPIILKQPETLLCIIRKTGMLLLPERLFPHDWGWEIKCWSVCNVALIICSILIKGYFTIQTIGIIFLVMLIRFLMPNYMLSVTICMTQD